MPGTRICSLREYVAYANISAVFFFYLHIMHYRFPGVQRGIVCRFARDNEGKRIQKSNLTKFIPTVVAKNAFKNKLHFSRVGVLCRRFGFRFRFLFATKGSFTLRLAVATNAYRYITRRARYYRKKKSRCGFCSVSVRRFIRFGDIRKDDKVARLIRFGFTAFRRRILPS